LKPNLALTYNHLAGNGLAGMRVSLSGFSSIQRCNFTTAQDGWTGGFNYVDSWLALCLDGQRLAGISGTYGQNGAEYRTEIESFQRIKSVGSAGSTAAYFTVEHGDGSISYYGYTTDSRIEKVGSSEVRIWYLSHREDQFGNRISYSYSESTDGGTGAGIALPSTVTWTSNSGQGLSAHYRITINYESRPAGDARVGYGTGGAFIGWLDRISDIEVEVNTGSWQEIATYTLGYASTVPSTRSQLETVTLSRGSDSLPATTFTWQDATVGWDSAYDTNRSTGSYPLVGDFNNDGRQDIFVSLSSKWQVYLGQADRARPVVRRRGGARGHAGAPAPGGAGAAGELERRDVRARARAAYLRGLGARAATSAGGGRTRRACRTGARARHRVHRAGVP
jgi:hypothetical protein